MAASERESLLTGARRGDTDCQERLVAAYQRRVAGFVHAMTGRTDEVEDLTQIILVRALLDLSRLRQPERFEPWLFRIARNACLDHLRRRRWRRLFVPHRPEHDEIAAPAADSRIDWEALRQALQNLPPAQRELVALLEEGDWSYAEMARMTGRTERAVKALLFRARERLRAFRRKASWTKG